MNADTITDQPTMNTEPRFDLITLAQIREHEPCAGGWRTLTRAVGSDLDTIVSLGDIAYTNGVDDALWALRCLPDTIEARRFAVSLVMPAVKRAAQHTTDERVHRCVADLERWLCGDDTVDLSAADAASAAYAAAWAAWAARAASAAYAAAWAARAARAASAAYAAAWAARAARAAAWAADAAASADWEAERERQKHDIIALSPRTNATNEKEN